VIEQKLLVIIMFLVFIAHAMLLSTVYYSTVYYFALSNIFSASGVHSLLILPMVEVILSPIGRVVYLMK